MADWTQGAASAGGGGILVFVLLWLKPILLKKLGNGNGSSGVQPVSFWENKFEKLAERNEKSFENALKIMVVPILEKTNDILRESREDARQQLDNTQKLTEAIIKLTLRDEVREQMRRGASA